MGITKRPKETDLVVSPRSVRDQVQLFAKRAGKVTLCHSNNFDLEMKGLWISKVFQLAKRTSEEDLRARFQEEGFMSAEPEHMMAQVYSFYQAMYAKYGGNNSNWCLISLGREFGGKALILSSIKGAITKLSEFGTEPWEWDGYLARGTYVLAVKRKRQLED